MDLDATLRRLARDPADPVDLAELALLLAADEYPQLYVPAELARVDDLADELRPRLETAVSLEDQVAELTALLFDEHGFRGDADDYYSPRNSYLNDVLDRKRGIPITLTVLAAAVGERCGMELHGVGLPGHFVAKAVGPDGEEVLFDPFHGGRRLDREACAALVESVTGQPFAVCDASVAAVPPGGVALRMLTNLKLAYLRAGDPRRAARVTSRLARLCPADALQRRDLGVLLARSGELGRAIPHLQKYLKQCPDADDAPEVKRMLQQAWREVARWN